MTTALRQAHDRAMRMNLTLAWLVDEAAGAGGAGDLLAELGAHLVADGLPLAGGALTLDVPHPLIARRAWLWRAEGGEVIEGLGFASAGLTLPSAAERSRATMACRDRGRPRARGRSRAESRCAEPRLGRSASLHPGRSP